MRAQSHCVEFLTVCRYEIKKTLCESSDKVRSGASLGADGQVS